MLNGGEMSTSIKVIKFTGILSVIFLAFTYLITVNMKSDFIHLNTIWISNNFLLTVFGGLFTSTLVVLLCEFNKYMIDKENTEDQLFCQTLYLYQALFLMQHQILDFQEHSDAQISENLLDSTTHTIKNQVYYLRTLNYACFKKNNDIEKRYILFKTNTHIKFAFLENGMNLLRCAILKERIDNYKSQKSNPDYITASSSRVAKVLSDQMDILTPLLGEIEQFLTSINDNCKNRYNWNEIHKQILTSYVSLFSTQIE